MVLAVRRMGVAARGRAAAGSTASVRLLGVAIHVGAENTAAESSRHPRDPHPATLCSTAPARAKAHMSGSSPRVLPDGEIVTVEGNYAGHVTRVGPFHPAHPVGEAAPIYGYAQPPAANPPKAGGAG